ncbi:MAG: AAA family ATPase [Patescibacteria group bacterium]
MEKIPNFHEISEKRKEHKKALNELGEENGLEKKFLSTKLESFDKKAKGFKVADYGGIGKAVDFMRQERAEAEEELLAVDLEAIYEQFPEFREIKETEDYLQLLKDKRMEEFFGFLGAKKVGAKQGYEMDLESTNEMIGGTKSELEKFAPLDIQAVELIGYKQNLSESGHICLTPSTEKNLEAIGDKMLSGKPVFLHGLTGTGKTTLAEYAAKHYTSKDAEMVYCSPQTKESNIWGHTGIEQEAGVPITKFVYGPLAKALAEGRVIIFDEFTNLPDEQISFLKGVFSKKVGDSISVQGNGEVIMAKGFQMIFTANLKSEKNPNKKALPAEMADEFTQNNLEINYTPKNEAYDIMLARLLNTDGSLELSYYDLNITLKNLCEAMSEIQESYVKGPNLERARVLGELGVNNKTHSFEKFVMTQRSIEAIISLWDIEKKKGDRKVTFAEFIDERIKTAVNFKEFSEKDRTLAAKIFASRGFLTGVKPEELGVPKPQEVLKLNTRRAMRGNEAVEELQKESGAIKHLTLKEVAGLDPFSKRAEFLKNRAEALLGEEGKESESSLDSWPEHFRSQYDSGHQIWEKLGLIQRLSGGGEGLVGINGQEYAFPTFAEIAKRLEAKKELIKEKIKQGFTRLLIVPFGSRIDDLMEKYKQLILGHHSQGKLLATKKNLTDPNQLLELDINKPFWIWDQYKNADLEGNLVYYPKEFIKDTDKKKGGHGGKTKTEILAENENAGWSVVLVENDPNIPRAGQGKIFNSRQRLEAGKTPTEYLAELDSVESGLTPEGWLTLAIIYLEETNQVIDDYQGNGSLNYNLGGWFPASGNVSHAYWHRDLRQASLGGGAPDNRVDSYGVRSGVRVD